MNAAPSPGVHISHDANILYFASFAEKLFKLCITGFKGKVPHVQLFVHLKGLPLVIFSSRLTAILATVTI